MKASPLVSIVMPAYNSEKYLKESVESVRNQTYTNWELLIIDDASLDETGNIAKQMEKEDKRIRLLINHKNQGVSGSRNRGVLEAKGDWIAFLDSDDLWEAQKLEKQIEFHGNEPTAQLIFTATAYMNEKGSRSKYILQVPYRLEMKKLLKQNIISCSSVLVKRDLLLEYRMPGDEFHEDYWVWLQILSKGIAAYGLNEPLFIYRISSGSKSGNKIKAAKMQYRVYRKVGLHFWERVYYMLWYGGLNFKKYHEIRKYL